MHVTSFKVRGLFRRYDHDVPFPDMNTKPPQPGLTILHGQNGIGKTTLLYMIAGIMSKDFGIFRRMPFASAELKFSDGSRVCVAPSEEALLVEYDGHTAQLSLTQTGPYNNEQHTIAAVEEYREHFTARTRSLRFDLITVERVRELQATADVGRRELESAEDRAVALSIASGKRLHDGPKSKRRRTPESAGQLAARVAQFMSAATSNYRQFFSTTEPDLFPKILAKLNKPMAIKSAELVARLDAVREKEERARRFGLAVEQWDIKELLPYLSLGEQAAHDSVRAVLASYTEALESRAEERDLVARRLQTLENVMNAFFLDKRLKVIYPAGFIIETREGDRLSESDLSSGELHLLLLMVSATLTHRRGSVIAIDEPEMSMHLAWQRNFVRSLLECSEGSQPQFLLTTHSPEIAAEHRSCMWKLKPEAVPNEL